jgi:cytosine deaminase
VTELRRINLDGRVVRMVLRDERIIQIVPDNGPATHTVIPLLNEPHVHLDKFDTASRARTSAQGLFGAIESTEKDKVNWSADDLRIRMSRALSEAYQFGCQALRTHLDWDSKEVPVAWEVLSVVMAEWRGKITVQRASLSPIDLYDDTEVATSIARRVNDDCGVLGAFVYRHGREAERIQTVFDMAEAFGLHVDFHVD